MLLAFAVARHWPQVISSAVSPGWVATKMGGAGAADNLEKAPETQAWLAVSPAPAALTTGQYWYHQQPADYLPAAADAALQDRFLAKRARPTGVPFPAGA